MPIAGAVRSDPTNRAPTFRTLANIGATGSAVSVGVGFWKIGRVAFSLWPNLLTNLPICGDGSAKNSLPAAARSMPRLPDQWPKTATSSLSSFRPFPTPIFLRCSWLVRTTSSWMALSTPWPTSTPGAQRLRLRLSSAICV